jgi:hypothetical protein
MPHSAMKRSNIRCAVGSRPGILRAPSRRVPYQPLRPLAAQNAQIGVRVFDEQISYFRGYTLAHRRYLQPNDVLRRE